MFLSSFAWSFVYVSLPFYIQRISPLDAAATLQWTGWILGITALVTVVTTPFWGHYAERWDPRRTYVTIQALQGVGFLGMVVTRSLPGLFLARSLLGVAGATSTIAFLLVGRSTDGAEVRRQVAAIQSAMTVGQVTGPLAGAIAAAHLGFRPSFVVGAAILFLCAGLIHWGLPPSSPLGHRPAARGRVRHAEVAVVALIVLGGTIQVFFLAAILPQVLAGLGVAGERTLEIGGVLIFVSGVAAAVGSLAAPRLGEVLPERRVVGGLLLGSSVLLAAMGLAGSAWSYGALRFFQVLLVAPVFPLAVAGIALHASGSAIGLVNAARMAATFVGPVMATTVLAWTSPWVLYVVLGALGIACVPLAGMHRSGRESP